MFKQKDLVEMNAELLKDMQRKLANRNVWDDFYQSHDANELYIEPLINDRLRAQFFRGRSISPHGKEIIDTEPDLLTKTSIHIDIDGNIRQY